MKRIYREFADEILNFGRFRGTKLRDVPLSYLKWLVINVSDDYLAEKSALELARRDSAFR